MPLINASNISPRRGVKLTGLWLNSAGQDEEESPLETSPITFSIDVA